MKTKLLFVISSIALISILPLSAAKYYLYTGSDPWGTRADGTKVQVDAGTLHTTLNSYAASDVIWIAAGTYTTSTSPAAIALKEGMSIYGGFFGDETTISQRQLADEAGGNGVVEPWEMKYPTIINGTGSALSLSTYIMFSQSTSYTLDGVTIDTHYQQGGNGGAINNGSATAAPVIRNCIFRNICKSTTSSSVGCGTVIYEAGMGTITCCLIENNILTGTVASNTVGGTIYAYTNPTITRNVIRNNTVNGNASITLSGSAIWLRAFSGTPAGLVANNVIYNNTSRNAAIIFSGSGCAFNIVNNTIVNNFGSGTTASWVTGIVTIPTNAKIYNNLDYNNAYINLTTFKSFNAAASAAVDLQNNAYNGTTTVGTNGSFTSQYNNASLTTPNFVNPSTTIGYTAVMPADVKAANFALQATATDLIDKAGYFAGVTPTVDILGNPRSTTPGTIAIGAYESECRPINIALNKMATASNIYSALYPASKAIDGNYTTRWATASGVTAATLDVDLGGSYTFSQVVIREHNARVTSYKIQYWNGTDWLDAYTGTTIGTTDKTVNFIPATGSKVRLNILAASNSPTIYEFAVNAFDCSINQKISDFSDNTNINVSRHLTIDITKTVAGITIAPGAKLTINNGSTLTATNGVTLQSDATGTATILNSGSYTGTITTQQYLGSARNWYVSSPVQVTNSPANNITRYYEYVEAGTNADFSVTGSTAYWKGLSTGTLMAVGKGYIAQASAGTTIQFTGTPNNGNITTTFDLTRDEAKGKGFNLVGNPYPSYIDWSLVAAANPNLSKTFYFRSKNTNETSTYTFVSYNGLLSTSVSSNGTANTNITRFIPPTQAFWVRVNTGTSTTNMYFNNDMRSHRDDNGNLLKAPKADNRTRLRLQLMNGSESDETLICTDANADNSFDVYDSPKMMNSSTVTPDLYTKADDERLVINGLNSISDNMELPLGFSLNAAASLKLKATEISNFPAETQIYLLDKIDNVQTELLPETEYSFTATTAITNNESRFSLLFRVPDNTTEITKTKKQNAQIFVNTANQITIIASEKTSYSIYNAVGQKIENGVVNSKLETINSKLSSGVYFVKLSLNERSEVQKVIIR